MRKHMPGVGAEKRFSGRDEKGIGNFGGLKVWAGMCPATYDYLFHFHLRLVPNLQVNLYAPVLPDSPKPRVR
jgi:hypothetical protein